MKLSLSRTFFISLYRGGLFFATCEDKSYSIGYIFIFLGCSKLLFCPEQQ